MKMKKKTPENCISIRMHTTELSSVAGEMDWRAAKEEAQKRGSRCDLEPAQRRKEPGLAIARSVSIYPPHSSPLSMSIRSSVDDRASCLPA